MKYLDSDPSCPAMTYLEIAEQLTLEEGVKYTEDRVRMIYNNAIKKLRKHLQLIDSL